MPANDDGVRFFRGLSVAAPAGMLIWLGLALLLFGCAESKPLVLGEQTYAPGGYTTMCRDRPEAFSCPR